MKVSRQDLTATILRRSTRTRALPVRPPHRSPGDWQGPLSERSGFWWTLSNGGLKPLIVTVPSRTFRRKVPAKNGGLKPMIAAVPSRTFLNALSRDSRRHFLPQAISAWSERSEVKKIPAISEYPDIL